jgi:hypothetical protein
MAIGRAFGVGFAILAALLFRAPAADAVPVFNPANGHYYELVDLPVDLNWGDAAAAAAAASHLGLPGHLVTITSTGESQFIQANFPAPPDFVWIGLFQAPGTTEPGTPTDGSAGGWQWVTGEPFYLGEATIFHNWSGGEPNNSPAIPGFEEDAVELTPGTNATGRVWNDTRADFQRPYIVEYQSVPEPATGGLIAGAGLLLAARAWWRRRHPGSRSR